MMVIVEYEVYSSNLLKLSKLLLNLFKTIASFFVFKIKRGRMYD